MGKRVWTITLGTLLIVGFAIWYIYPEKPGEEPEIPTPGKIPSREEIRAEQPASQLFGESILAGYGAGRPEDDLRQMNALMQNYRMLAKGMDARHFASNESFASVLRGENRIALQALPQDHKIFNREGQIIDRWGNPLRFHLETEKRVSIFSAGPDGTLGTDDDYSFKNGITKQSKAEF